MELRGALKETCADRGAQRRIAFFLALVLFAIVLLRHAWLCDDAFITLRTVRNLLEGFGPVWQPGERVQAYTHPLWMLLLAGGARLLTDLYLTAMVVSLILSVAAFAVFLFGLRHDTAAALLGAALLVSCKSFMEYSTSGLENPLTHLLYVVLIMGVLVTPRPTLTSNEDYGLQGPPIDPRGVSDERAVYYDATGFLRSPAQRRLGFRPFVFLGQHLAAGQATVTSNVGRLGFFARPDAIIIDELGLTDPLIARLPKKPGPWRVGHLFRRIPDGYQATREQGRNLISDPEIAEFYRHLDPIVHGPIWTWTRFVEIWRMNTGAWSPSLDASPGSVR
jgi:hypothetical protein